MTVVVGLTLLFVYVPDIALLKMCGKARCKIYLPGQRFGSFRLVCALNAAKHGSINLMQVAQTPGITGFLDFVLLPVF